MRNKKFLIVFAALVVSVSAGLFASGTVGIGVQGGYVPSPYGYGDTAITFKIPNVPPVFAVNVGIWGNQVHRVGATADWWLANPNIVGVLNWYYGPGLAAGATFNVRGDRACDLYVGGRFVVGLNAWRAGMFCALNPMVATTLGILFLGESFAAQSMIGGVFILAGILLAELPERNVGKKHLLQRKDVVRCAE